MTYTTLAGNQGNRRMEIDGFCIVKRTHPDPDQATNYFRMMPEIELSPKQNPRFVDQKILPDLAYIRSEIYLKRFGSNTGRWLYMVDTMDKLEGYRNATGRAVDETDRLLFYFTTFDQITPETILFEPIWWRPGDKEP